jgi:hypothetical protein
MPFIVIFALKTLLVLLSNFSNIKKKHLKRTVIKHVNIFLSVVMRLPNFGSPALANFFFFFFLVIGVYVYVFCILYV